MDPECYTLFEIFKMIDSADNQEEYLKIEKNDLAIKDMLNNLSTRFSVPLRASSYVFKASKFQEFTSKHQLNPRTINKNEVSLQFHELGPIHPMSKELFLEFKPILFGSNIFSKLFAYFIEFKEEEPELEEEFNPSKSGNILSVQEVDNILEMLEYEEYEENPEKYIRDKVLESEELEPVGELSEGILIVF